MNKFLAFFSLIIAFSGCSGHDHMHQEVTISSDNIAALKQKYSAEVFTYFYETVFFSDPTQEKIDITNKWLKDIKLIILGNPTAYEAESVKSIVDLINQQGLPIDLSIVNRESEANFQFYFGTYEELDSIFDLSPTTAGTAISTSVHGRIKNIESGIIRNADTDDKKRKKAVILEEMIQSLGISGDSYAYPNSIFFEGRNYQDEFIDLDREVLRLLYDPLMPVNYPRVKFEADFGDMLYPLNISARLSKKIQEKKIAKSTLEQIGQTCFIEGVFYKHPRQVALYLYGAYEVEDSLQVQKTIAAVNEISEYLQISLTPFANDYPTSGIILNFKNNPDQEYTVMSSIETLKGSAMFPKRVKNDVNISYKPGKDGQRKKSKHLMEIIYKCLGPIEMKEMDGLFTEEDGKLRFGDDFKAILNLIYDPEFADGYTLEEFEQLIMEL